jgi:hypothetical protein
MEKPVHTEFGDLYLGTGPCKDNYPNIITVQTAAGQMLTLQAPAARAFLQAERLNGRKLPWREHRKPKPIAITGVGRRTCASQQAYYDSDHERYAPPSSSRHCRARAVDIFNTARNLTRRARRCLIKVGFSFPVSGEPWHACYGPDPG